MSYFILFKDKSRDPIRISDEEALAVARAKEKGIQIQVKGSYIDTVMIGEIIEASKLESRGATNQGGRPAPDYRPSERSGYNLALVELMKASRFRPIKDADLPDWVKPEHRKYVAGTSEYEKLPVSSGVRIYA